MKCNSTSWLFRGLFNQVEDVVPAVEMNGMNELEDEVVLASESDALMLTAAENEQFALFIEQKNKNKPIIDKLAQEIIAFCGAEQVLSFIPEDNKSSNLLGIILFRELEPKLIQIICDHLYSRIVDASEGKDADSRVGHLKISIERQMMAKANLYDLPYLDDVNPASCRNDSEPGLRTLTAANKTNNDTLKSITDDITIEGLKQSIVDYIVTFIVDKYGAKAKESSHYLQSVLRGLKGQLELQLEELALYAATVLHSAMNDLSNDQAVRKALGTSLNAVSLPVCHSLYTDAEFNSASDAQYTQKIESYIKGIGDIRSGLSGLNGIIESKDIFANYQNYFYVEGQPHSDDGIALALTPTESVLVKHYLSVVYDERHKLYNTAFANLCSIDWKDKLNFLFLKSKPKNHKEKLWDKTEKHFANRDQSQGEDEISNAERIEVKDIANKDPKNLSPDDIEKLYSFFNSHRSTLEEDKDLRQQWTKLIFSNEKYVFSNFMLSLATCMINNLQVGDDCQSAESHSKQQEGGDSQRVELRLITKPLALRRLNKDAAYYFSHRFGAYLRLLRQELGDRFVIKGPESGSKNLDERKAKAEQALMAIFNYREFLESINKPLKDTADEKKKNKKNCTLKFELHFISDSDITVRELSWTYSSDQQLTSYVENLDDLRKACAKGKFSLFTGHYNSKRAISFKSIRNNSNQANANEDAVSQSNTEDAQKQANLMRFAIGKNIKEIIAKLKIAPKFNEHLHDKVLKIEECFNDFKGAYANALDSLYECKLCYKSAKDLSDLHTKLQLSIIDLMHDEQFDSNYDNDLKVLLASVLKVGMAYTDDDAVYSAAASPFTVENMRSHTAKLERLCDIIKSLMSGGMDIGDSPLFNASLKNDMDYFDGPELCVSDRLNEANLSYLCAFEDHCGYTFYKKVAVNRYQSFTYVPLKEYSTTVVDFIKRNIETRPLIPEQYSIMLRDCLSAELAEILYKDLSDVKELSSTKIHLVIVNSNTADSERIYKRFEILRCNGLISAEQLKRVQVSILTATEDPNKFGTYVRYINKSSITASVSNSLRTFDVSVLMHSFDMRSTLKYNEHNVSLVKDEVHTQPSLVNRNNTALISSDNVGKFLVNQIQTIGRIQYYNSLSEFVSDTHKSKSNNFTQSLEAVRNYLDGNGEATNYFSTYLPYRVVSKSDSLNGNYDDLLIGPIHDRSEVVLFLDEIQCRRLVSNSENRLVYYSKLKNQALNMLVSSSPHSTNAQKYLRYVYEKSSDKAATAEEFCKYVHNDATFISGGLLTRAENGRKSTFELVGNVMCKFIAEQISSYLIEKMNVSQVTAIPAPIFVSLDDYQYVLSTKKSEHADVMCIQVLSNNSYDKENCDSNKYTLCVSVIESKFLDKYLPASANKSRKQTRASLENLLRPLKVDAVDRSQFLSKFADMIADNCNTSSIENNKVFSEIQKMIREEQVDLQLMGYSMVFALSSDTDKPDNRYIEAVADHKFDENKNDDARIIQLHVYPRALSRMFNRYCEIKGNRYGASGHAMLSEWLEYDKMSDLAAYLDTKRPKLIHIRRKVEEYVPMSLNTQIASLAQDEASAQSEPQGNGAAKAGTKASKTSKTSKTSSSKSASTKEASEKPKRGRPRKTATAQEANAASEPQIKPKRGRPRKSDAKDEVEVLTPMPHQQFLNGLDD